MILTNDFGLMLFPPCFVFLFVCSQEKRMDNQEGQSSVNGGEGQHAGQGVPGVGTNIDRLIEALATFA